jgi:hypothetical protein
LAARWRSKAEMASRFDSPTPILYRRSVEIFRLSLTVQKIFECNDSTKNLVKNVEFSGGFDPEM